MQWGPILIFDHSCTPCFYLGNLEGSTTTTSTTTTSNRIYFIRLQTFLIPFSVFGSLTVTRLSLTLCH